MNKLITISLAILCFGMYGQEGRFPSDTLYIKFEECKNQIKGEAFFPNDRQGQTVMYTFMIDEKGVKKPLDFWQHQYMSKEKQMAGVKSETRSVDKAFLKQNSDKIVDWKFLNSYGRRDFLFDFAGKTFYIIDCSDRKNIMLREVFRLTSVPYEQ